MDNKELEISFLRCQLCRYDIKGKPFELQLIEQTIQTCSECFVQVHDVIANITLKFKNINEGNKNKIELVMNSSKVFYKLQKQICKICHSYIICSKICCNEHYFCLKCQESYILNEFDNFIIKCPHIGCDQIIDDLVIFWFMRGSQFKQWVIDKYYFLCPNQSCKTQLQIIPFQKVETQIIQVDINLSQCISCQNLICANCWKVFKEPYSQHQSICNSDRYIMQLQKKSIIVQCPKCKFYSEQDCKMKNQKIQECPICITKFCLFCKSADLQLYYNQELSHYACDCYQNFYKRKFIQYILYCIIYFIYMILIGFAVYLGNKFTNFIEEKVQSLNFRFKSCLYFIFFLFIIIFKIFSKFFKFMDHNEQFLVTLILRMVGINDEIEFLYQQSVKPLQNQLNEELYDEY